MKKIKMSLRDEHFGSILCQNNIRATKTIKFTFSNYDKTVDEIINMFYKFSSLNEILMYDIYFICQTLGYFLEESHDLKINPDCKLKVNGIKQFLADSTTFGILLYVDLFPADIDDSMKRYLANDIQTTYDLYGYMPRGSGKSHLNSLMIRDYRELLDKAHNDIGFIFNKSKGGETNMIKLLPNPKRVICSGTVTTVIYGDGSKTHVRKTEDDENDYEKAFLLSWLYKTYGKSVVEKKLKEFSSEFTGPEEPAYMGAVAEALNHVMKMSIGKKK